jgi:flagellar hook-associated protein 3 FlgL
MIVNKSMYPVQTSFSSVLRLKSQLATLQVQMATGEKAANLAEMGSDRSFELTLRSRMSRIAGYQDTIKTVDLRLDVLDQAVSRLDEIEADARGSAAPGSYGADGINKQALPSLSSARLDEVLAVLNTDVAGRFLFGGGITDEPPVAAMDEILNGADGRDGFRTIVGERRAADAGTDGRGRLTVSTAGPTVTLGEDGDHPFGFKLSTLATSSGAVGLDQPDGVGQDSLGVTFTGTPIAGETVSIGLTLPDGTSRTVTLTAVEGTAGPGQFQIGATPDDTAANFATGLGDSLLAEGGTTLAAASAFAAADNFFNGHGEPAMRVVGSPPETATALVAATADDTVQWYRGEDAENARQTVSAKVDDSTAVHYGVQANETGILELVRSLAAMSVEIYPSGDATGEGRFDAMVDRQRERLAESHNSENGAIEVITLELGVARATAGTVAERHTAYDTQLDTMLADVSQVSIEEVAMQLLALNTRLQASYQTTSMVSQLSLVNFLR